MTHLHSNEEIIEFYTSPFSYRVYNSNNDNLHFPILVQHTNQDSLRINSQCSMSIYPKPLNHNHYGKTIRPRKYCNSIASEEEQKDNECDTD